MSITGHILITVINIYKIAIAAIPSKMSFSPSGCRRKYCMTAILITWNAEINSIEVLLLMCDTSTIASGSSKPLRGRLPSFRPLTVQA